MYLNPLKSLPFLNLPCGAAHCTCSPAVGESPDHFLPNLMPSPFSYLSHQQTCLPCLCDGVLRVLTQSANGLWLLGAVWSSWLQAAAGMGGYRPPSPSLVHPCLQHNSQKVWAFPVDLPVIAGVSSDTPLATGHWIGQPHWFSLLHLSVKSARQVRVLLSLQTPRQRKNQLQQ